MAASVYIGTVGMLSKLQSLEPLKQICLMGSWFSLSSGRDMQQRKKNKHNFLKAIAVFHCPHACACTELGEVTHFQAGSPMNKCSDRTKKSQTEMTVSADLYHLFSFLSFLLENNTFFQIVKVPAISFDTLTAKDVKDQDSPVNIQHAIYSFFFTFLFYVNIKQNSMVLKPQLL